MKKLLGWGILLLVGFGIYGAFVTGKPAPPVSGTSQPSIAFKAPDPAPVKVATLDKSAAMQADRKAFIEKAISLGAFQKVEVPGDLPRLWVRPAFYGLDFDEKQKFVSVVYAYYFDGSNETDTVRIFDSQTGKEVGSYAEVQGGLRLH